MDHPPAGQFPGLGVQRGQHLAVDAGVAARLAPGAGTKAVAIGVGIGLDHPGVALVADPGHDLVIDRLDLDVARSVQATVLDLLEHQHLVRHRLAALVEQGVEVAVGGGRGEAVAANDQRPGHAAGHLQGRRTVAVAVVPEGACRVVARDVVFVLELHAGIDRQQHIVAVARRADPQAVRMEVGAIEAVRRVDRPAGQDAAGIGRQFVVERDPHGVARSRLDGRGHIGRGLRDVGPIIAAQMDLVVNLGGRVEQLAVCVDDLEVEPAVAGLGGGRRRDEVDRLELRGGRGCFRAQGARIADYPVLSPGRGRADQRRDAKAEKPHARVRPFHEASQRPCDALTARYLSERN